MTAQVISLSQRTRDCPDCRGQGGFIYLEPTKTFEARLAAGKVETCPACCGRGRVATKPPPMDPVEAFAGLP